MGNFSEAIRYVSNLGTEIIFDMDHGYAINKPKGIDNLSVSYSEAVGAERIGTQILASSVAHRPVTITGYVTARPSAAFKQLLIDAFLPEVGGKLYIGDYYLETQVTAAPTVSHHRVLPEFSVQLLAPYPYWQRTNRYYTQILDGYARISNNQALSCGYDIRINFVTGAATSIEVLETGSGQFVKLRGKTTDFFQAGDSIAIVSDHDGLRAVSASHGDISGLITADSRLRRIPPGSSTLSLSMSGSSIPSISGGVYFRPEKAGVVL